jgi:hypothetical protein
MLWITLGILALLAASALGWFLGARSMQRSLMAEVVRQRLDKLCRRENLV